MLVEKVTKKEMFLFFNNGIVFFCRVVVLLLNRIEGFDDLGELGVEVSMEVFAKHVDLGGQVDHGDDVFGTVVGDELRSFRQTLDHVSTDRAHKDASWLLCEWRIVRCCCKILDNSTAGKTMARRINVMNSNTAISLAKRSVLLRRRLRLRLGLGSGSLIGGGLEPRVERLIRVLALAARFWASEVAVSCSGRFLLGVLAADADGGESSSMLHRHNS